MARLLSCFGKYYRCDADHYLDVHYLSGEREHITGPVQICFSAFKHESISVKNHRRYIASDRQCLDVVHRDGAFERINGPAQLTYDEFRHESISVHDMERSVASQGQYLIIQYKDGRKEHVRGPHTLCFHPLEHEAISVHDALKLAANEAVVVYRRVAHEEEGTELVAKLEVMPTGGTAAAAAAAPKKTVLPPLVDISNGAPAPPAAAAAERAPPLLTAEAAGQEGAVHVERRVVHGPAIFIPEANEWLHSFSWHGSKNADGKGSKTGYVGDVKVPHAINFTVIRCMPDSMYLSVRDVRTIDDANLTVHLMLFYELQSIETMLDSTNDMIGDFVNAASADVMTLASRLTYESFLQQTAELSKASNFPILSSRMAQTGVGLLKVVYRGYGASAQLQEMHDQAISRRTKLRLEADAAREEQEKRAMELRCRQERSVQEQELEESSTKHRLEVARLQAVQQREEEEAEHERALRHESERAKVELANARASHEAKVLMEKELGEVHAARAMAEAHAELSKYEGMKAMGVDLTAYLVALAAAKPDHNIKLDNAGGTAPPTIHLELPRAAAQRK